jgi:hypothetical protein
MHASRAHRDAVLMSCGREKYAWRVRKTEAGGAARHSRGAGAGCQRGRADVSYAALFLQTVCARRACRLPDGCGWTKGIVIAWTSKK